MLRQPQSHAISRGMSDEKGPNNPIEELQKNLQDLFKQGKGFAPFGMTQNPAASGAASSPSQTPEKEEEERNEVLERIKEFNFKPKEIRDYLDRFVIKQDEAKKVISVAICDHYNHVRQCLENPRLRESDYAKQNIILLGPTGVGKTYLMRNVAKLIGVPFVKADATKFSETGYVGGDVEDLVRDLVKTANNDVELAQYGIIYIDEIDKIANQTEAGGRDVSGRGVQINLLKLMEETEINLQSQNDILGQMQAAMDMQRGGKPRPKSLSTRHILFIVSGAFDKMDKSIKKRLTTVSMGFGSAQSDQDEDEHFLNKAESRDFIDYGFEPEFTGRLPVRVACQPLKSEDLLKILVSSEGSILNQYMSDFKGYGISPDISRSALEEIANRAHKEKTGARGLMTVLERVFRDFKFELPSTSIKRFEVGCETVRDPNSALKNLLRDNSATHRETLKEEIGAFVKRFLQNNGFTLSFKDDAIEALVDESVETDKTIRALCERKFRDFQHGLTLISRNTGQTDFDITREVIENAEEELSNWVVASYEKDKETD